MAGDHHEPTAVKKNIYVEGIVNYRDQIHERFFQRANNRRSILTLGLLVVVIPGLCIAGTMWSDRSNADRRAEFMKKYQMPQSRKDTMNIKE